MATTLKTKLQIDAEGNARAEVEALATDLEKMADKGDEAAPAFKELAAQLRALGQQQGLIDQFSKLKDTTASYAEEAKNAQAATKASALALKESQSELAASAAAEKALAESLAQARAQHEQIGDGLDHQQDAHHQQAAADRVAVGVQPVQRRRGAARTVDRTRAHHDQRVGLLQHRRQRHLRG